MSRRQLSVTLGIAGLLSLALLFALMRPGMETPKSVTTPSPSPKPEAISPPAAVDESAAPTPTPSNSVTPAVGTSLPLTFEERQQRFIAAFHTPIRFFGKVVDKQGEPVTGAEVKLSANDKPFGGSPSEYTRQTDTDGRFSIDSIVGLTLYVIVSKTGYRNIPRTNSRVVTSSALFDFGVEGSVHSVQPDKDNPVIFTLHKVGLVEPLVRIEERSFRIARDGTPLSISLDQQGGHEVVLRCWNKQLEPRPAGERKYDWRLEVSVPSGGLVARPDELAFEAPSEGYNSGDTIEMLASMPFSQWDSFAARSYFLRFGDGTFARARVDMHAAGDHFVAWESFFNPKPGSRNLESEPDKKPAN